MENEQPIISKENMAKLLGRSLSTTEDNDYELYLDIAIMRLEDLLCLKSLPDELPVDMQLLVARCFGVIATEQSVDGENIKEKRVEDFSISYDTNSQDTPMSKFVKMNISIIAKYSQCQGKIKSGELRYGCCIHCI